ncbi:MAG: hypothetical protein LBV21_04105, partial [Candidatus Adiutrix sp.]|nr:hypothetical protein [Candidatus Adiutrix sp.]
MRGKKAPVILTGLLGLVIFGGAMDALPGEPRNHTNSIGLEFVLIPAGTFVMGSSPDDKTANFDLEKPAHRVTISRPV